jgi:cytochrome P450 / NADPH-cytochrome P450 reductase
VTNVSLLQGLASTYLTACKPGDLITCNVASAPNFHLPMDPACPAIFVAAGVGVAPFRSFWMERSARAKVLGGLAPAVLFFGCRSKAADCLFHEARARSAPLGCFVSCSGDLCCLST